MLSSNKIYIGHNHIHLAEIDSTNVFAQEFIAKNNPIEGMVISADFQTAGKGQFDRKWVSNKGENIMMSIILTPNFLDISKQALLNIAISLGILDYFNSKVDSGFRLKWPNDIYYEDKKLGGILIQNQILGLNLKYSIVGIGLNINQKSFSGGASNPISLNQITEQYYDLEREMNLIWHYLNLRYDQLKDRSQHMPLLRSYNQNLYHFNKEVSLINEEQGSERVKILGIDLLGRLNVKRVNGATSALEHGNCTIIYE
jgi:BirA family transcriptional regulator, biotin operon repressor / biotin---[acetyl-CoA-carboxylase] ligase